MKKSLPAVLQIFALGILLYVVLVAMGCRSTPPGQGQPEPVSFAARVVNCGTEAIRESWPRAYPQVMHCLTALIDSPMQCLDAVPAAVGVGIDTVACIVRGGYIEAARQSERNPEDTVSLRKTERARAWLDNKGVVFE